MKKIYIVPQMDTYRIQMQNSLLDTSNLNPEEWTGGGNAGGRLLDEDAPLNILLNDEFGF
ncbi:MAG: hypothetical protein IJ190_00280 [Prevotella sp.]|nr:hypothetical protein [Prevotella sp.]